jgi:hypothetical protein
MADGAAPGVNQIWDGVFAQKFLNPAINAILINANPTGFFTQMDGFNGSLSRSFVRWRCRSKQARNPVKVINFANFSRNWAVPPLPLAISDSLKYKPIGPGN